MMGYFLFAICHLSFAIFHSCRIHKKFAFVRKAGVNRKNMKKTFPVNLRIGVPLRIELCQNKKTSASSLVFPLANDK